MWDQKSMVRTIMPHFTGLPDLPIPSLLPDQIRRFTIESLRAKRIQGFDARATLDELRGVEGKRIIAADIGGDKLTACYFVVRDGVIHREGELSACQGDRGRGYLPELVALAGRARRERISVGISFAGPVGGTRLLAAPNLPDFAAEFGHHYDSDFARLFSDVQVTNDAVAGLMAGAIEAARCHPDVHDVLYLINGSGLGGAVLTGNVIYASEPGHVEIAHQLNTFGQRKACGLGGARYACVEGTAASKAGVEDIWRQRTLRRLSGREISARYQAGDRLARDLYASSALITAHVIAGMAQAFGLSADPESLAVVCHGGIFYVPGYGSGISRILDQAFGGTPRFLFTRDFSPNTCLAGAAVAAVHRTL